MLTEDQIEQRLLPWKLKYIELMAAYDSFYSLTGTPPDSKLMAPIFDVLEAYTEVVSEIVGDRCEWLKWYAYECRMGCHPMAVVIPGEAEFEVQTLRHIAHVIAAPSSVEITKGIEP